MGSNKILNLEKGYDLDPVRSGFNEEYRNVIAKNNWSYKEMLFFGVILNIFCFD